MEENVIVGLDIGITKNRLHNSEVDSNGELKIIE